MSANPKPSPHDVQQQTALIESLVENAASAGNGFEVEWRLRTHNGEPTAWFVDRAWSVCDRADQSGGGHGIVIDIAEHKFNELALARYRQDLEAMVNERTSRLSAAQQEQQHLNRTLRLLSDCNITLAAATDEKTLLNDLCGLIVRSENYLLASFSVPDETEGMRILVSQGKCSLPDALCRSLPHKAASTPHGEIRIILANKVPHAPRCENQLSSVCLARQSHGCIALPILIEEKVEAVLTIHTGNSDGYGDQEHRLLAELAANTALGLKTLRARKELEEYRQNLEKLVAERTREIAALNDELATRADEAEAANQAKGEFLATMSHEIRTPLNAVIGLTSLLAETSMNRQQRNFTEKIHLAAQNLRTLIDDILDFSKIEIGSLVLERAPFSLETVLRTVASMIAASIRAKSIEAIFDIAPETPDLLIGDAFRLQQVLLNLSSNAVKFTECGEIVMSVSARPVDSQHVQLQFSVLDTGIGIAEEKIEQIFAAFTQADSSTSRRYGGSGLGLAISARLVEAMGGKLAVQSIEGQGSDFHFTLDLPLATTGQPMDSDTLPGLRLLVVDDHPRVGQILERTSRHFGWAVKFVSSAAACLDELQRSSRDRHDYDLLLLDWHLPGMDGLEMLRAAHRTPGIGLPLVVLMASADEVGEAIAASEDLYIDGIVAKPLTPASLFDAISGAYTGAVAELPPLRATKCQSLNGLSLLVAEDNTLNREVIQQILTGAGAKVGFVENGEAAVRAVEQSRQPFDAVLMDIQMPIMDGHDATRKIRANPAFADLPIIALTAFALPEDREKSLRAGMTGHITKPIDVDDLLEILGHTARRTTAMPVPPSIAIPGIRTDIAIQLCGGDFHALVKLLRSFMEQNGDDAKRASDLLRAGDIEGAARTVHGARGVAAYLQATHISHFAAAAEEALRGQAPQDAGPALASLDQAMTALGNAVAQIEASLPASNAH